jgi:hypothetical protein
MRSRSLMVALNSVMLCIAVIFLGIIAFELVKVRRLLTSGKPEDASQENS